MHVSRSPKASDLQSNFNSIRQGSESLINKNVPNQTYDDRSKTQNQLVSFYMPYLKKIYQQNKYTSPMIRPPEQLIFNSKTFQMKQAEIKNKLQVAIKDSESKQQKIRQLSSKVSSLTQRLKMYEPQAHDNDSFTNFTQTQKDIKRLQNLYKIKNQENFFSLKMKAVSLLEEFNVEKADIQGIHHIDNESAVFQFMMSKLKRKIKQLRNKSQTDSEMSEKQKMTHFKLEEQIRFLSDSNEMIRNSQKRLKQKLQEVKKQWSQSNQRLIQKQKQNEEMDVQIFRLKRLLEQKDGVLASYNSTIQSKSNTADDLKMQYEQQLKDQRALLNSYNSQINELKQQLQWKEGEFEQLKIDHNMKVHENDKLHREYVRWKDRYQTFQREKQQKYSDLNRHLQINRSLESENATLRQQMQSYQFSQPGTPSAELFDINGHSRVIEMLRNQVISKTDQVQRLKNQINSKKQGEKESTYIVTRKYQQLMKERENSFKTIKEQLIKNWNQSRQSYEKEINDYIKQIKYLESELTKKQSKKDFMYGVPNYGGLDYQKHHSQKQFK